MIRENKDLLVQDICSRLPHGVKVSVNSEYLSEGLIKAGYDKPLVVYGITADGGASFTLNKGLMEYSMPILSIKPYLFPLSSMTEEQKVEFEEVSELDVEYTITQIENNSQIWTSGLNIFNWFLKNHFDVYGLIPMGLAIDATNLNIY